MNREKDIAPEDLCEHSVAFLKKVLAETSKIKHDVRQDFVHRNGSYIFRLVDDVVGLEDQNRNDSPPILIRAMLEHLFSLVSASKQEGFAERKIIYDLEKEATNRKECLKKTARIADEDILDGIRANEEFAAAIRKKLGIDREKIRKGVEQCAIDAGLEKQYFGMYFEYCLYAHASTLAYVQHLIGVGPGLRLHALIFIVLTASLHILKTIPTNRHDALISEHVRLANKKNALLPKFQQLFVSEIGGDGQSVLHGKRTRRNQAN